MNICNSLKYGSQILRKNNFNSALIDSELLMGGILNQERIKFLLNLSEEISKEDFELYQNYLERRLKKEPIEHILNKKFFWNDCFYVNNKTLIPRSDTEIIVEEAIKILKYRKNLRILDIGTGSGCIILSILKDVNNCTGVGIDICEEALLVSKLNAKKLKISKNRLKLIKSDVDNFNLGKYDVIVTNPPYINYVEYKNLDKGVLNFEPKKALYGGIDGLSEIKKVICKASSLLKLKGKLLLEIAHNQRFNVAAILKHNGFYIEKLKKDLANKHRCFICTKIK